MEGLSLAHMVIIALLVFAHILTDFYFQTSSMARNKGQQWQILVKHVVVWILTAILLTSLYYSNSLLCVVLLLGCLHLIIDKLRVWIDQRCKNWYFESLVVDQMIHLACIIMSYPWLKGMKLNDWVADLMFKKNFLFKYYYPELAQVTEAQWVVVIAIVCVYLFNLRGVNFLVAKVLHQYTPTDYVAPKSSEFIGRLERLIIVTFVLLEAYTAIGMVFAAKSIARIKELDKEEFVPYYIVGTLASTLLAIASGLIVKGIIFFLYTK